MKIKLFIILFILLFFWGCKSGVERIADITKKSKEIRVKLKIDDVISITLDRDLVIKEAKTGKKVLFPYKIKKLIFKNLDGKRLINDKEFDDGFIFFNRNNKIIRINDNFYFGKIQINPLVSGFEIINTIPIETYLLSVIPSEVPLSFPFEALKAQAVIARTYSYYFIEKYRNSRNFDVDNTIMYQVYNGFNIKTDKKNIEKLKKALFSTTNKILMHKDKPILAYFHSNSGGITRSGGDYFGKSSDFEYLQSKEDPYSVGEKNDKWDYSLDFETFKNKLGIKNEITEDLSENMFEKDSNGFVKKFIYKDVSYQTKEIRKKIGYFELKSERFRVKIEENNVIFSGIGFGHGVGLSQYGAKKMAELGFKYDQIVNFYYPKTQVVEIKDL